MNIAPHDYPYYVVEIPSEYSVIINIGERDANIGDEVAIFEPGPEIIDPITGESLGNHDFLKNILEITETYPTHCVCEKLRKYEATKMTVSFASLLSSEVIKESEKINANPDHIKNWKIKTRQINIGDPVRII